MIEIRHMPADRRKHPRVGTPLRVVHGSERLGVVDWGPGGLRVAAAPPSLVAAEDVGLVITLPAPRRADGEVRDGDPATPVTLRVPARVVRRGPTPSEVALVFTGLPDGVARELHARASRGPGARALGGSANGPALPMGARSPGGSMNAPARAAAEAASPQAVDAVPTRFDGAARDAVPTGAPIRRHGGSPSEPAPPAAVPPAPTRWRPPGRTLVYLVAGLLLATYLGTSVYQRVWRIRVDAAAIVAPTVEVVSPSSGVIRGVTAAPGEQVALGVALFEVESPSARVALEAAETALARAEARVTELEGAVAAERARLSLHRRVLRSRIQTEEQQLTLADARVGIFDARVAQLGTLSDGRIASPWELASARERAAVVAGDREGARLRLATEQTRLDAAAQGLFMDGDRIPDGLREAEAAMAGARAERDVAKEQRDAQLRRSELLEVARAPFDARVVSVLHPVGTPVAAGARVAVVEPTGARRVEAWVTREEAEYVRLGDIARVSVAGLGRAYDAEVRSIDSDLEASIRAGTAGHAPRLRVVLDVVGVEGERDTRGQALRELDADRAIGLPAVVSFARSWQ